MKCLHVIHIGTENLLLGKPDKPCQPCLDDQDASTSSRGYCAKSTSNSFVHIDVNNSRDPYVPTKNLNCEAAVIGEVIIV